MTDLLRTSLAVAALAVTGCDDLATPPPLDATVRADITATADVPSDADDAPTQLGQVPGQPPGDLSIDVDRLRTSVQVQTRIFASTACEVAEGCTLAGRRRLLRFDLATLNLGAGDIALGPPVQASRVSPWFEWATCHQHFHLTGYADYRLYDRDGREVGRGRKQSFCLEDTDRVAAARDPMASSRPRDTRYDCRDQGIQRGWLDVYGRSLACQYVDITAVPAGRYTLRVRVNAERALAESDYTNDDADVQVEIPVETVDPPGDPTSACAGDDVGAARDCGWERDATSPCVPGASVTLGCDATCAPPLGVNDGDTVLRVCAGDNACRHEGAITENDDSGCGASAGSRVTFACPAVGRYTVLKGAARAGSPVVCVVAVAM